MAGIIALAGSGWNSSWSGCADNGIILPLDLLGLVFPIDLDGGEKVEGVGENVCFVPRRFSIPFLRDLLPPPSTLFSPDDLVDSIVCLIVLCVVTTLGMFVVKRCWEALDPRFASIAPPHKKWYVVANMTKTFYLAVLTFSHRYWIGAFNALVHDAFQRTELKRCGIIYITADTVALYMVSKLPRSTILHHIATNSLCLLIAGTNMSTKGWDGILGVSKMSLLYGLFGSVAFSVNAYLGLRVVYPNSQKLIPWLVKLSLWTYVATCAGNWSIHLLWFVGLVYNLEFSIYAALYLVAIAAMVNDDIVLIKWLVRKGSAFDQKSHAT